MQIPFNKPFLTGKEIDYIYQSVLSGKISGDGVFTQKCHEFFEKKFRFKKCLLTTSCTDALEMAAILLNIKEGDEVIIPAYTFVSTANAFVLRGAKIVFIDSCIEHPNIDVSKIESLITDKTKAIVVVHYSGVACDMDTVMDIANKYNLYVVEDAAQAISSYYKNRVLGSIGHLAAFSFHETKNIISGEGGMLVINDERFIKRAEIIREKGTNRSGFFRGEVDKYGWVDIGSSFLPSDIIAAFLYAQLENIDEIHHKRVSLWQRYNTNLSDLARAGYLKLPTLPEYASNNAHIYYCLVENIEVRQALIGFLKNNGIHAVFHYMPLHNSEYYKSQYTGEDLLNSNYFTNCLIRLPMFYDLEEWQVDYITSKIAEFFTI